MSGLPSGSKVLEPTDADIQKMLACRVHIGTKNVTSDMKHYVFARRKDGIHVLNLGMTWQKLMLAARIIVAVENPADVCVMSARPYGQRSVLKFAQYTGANYMAGRFTPGTFTNQIQDRFVQPRVLIVTDPRTDHQPVKESSYVNLPVIAFCDTDSPLKYVDVAIPCNNRAKQSIAMMYWLLAREILRMRGTLVRSAPWEVKVDLFLYRDPEDVMRREKPTDDDHAATTTYALTDNTKADADKGIDSGAAGNWGDEAAGGWDAATPQQWGVDS
eukprot:NODE_1200_length_957_cov_1408.694934_g687_i1.p1 GENE.NODE_1200_length_957_cov_1408.694934_g687_i1~~NODE_1200_length_957_cov_1408.694934_g687_i1.p1  ORF type:complete len:273 (+),score=80.97 NODE_1200_length_957_cov_1408.694934_g687_i1:91-909(+)